MTTPSRSTKVKISSPSGRGATILDTGGTVRPYVFRWNAEASRWVQESKLTEYDTWHFGFWVSFSGNLLFVGNPNSHTDGANIGSVYAYAVGPASTATPDCNDNGEPDHCEIAQAHVGDCNDNEIPDDCDIAEGTSEDCTSNGIPDVCEPDCNGNAFADSCDIASQTSGDCNSNDVPDECDFADGTSEDCNDNDTPDECEDDGDGDGVIDDCDSCAGFDDGLDADECGPLWLGILRADE